MLWVILGRDCCRFLVQLFFRATVSPRCFALLFFSLLIPPRHRVKAEQYKVLVFSLSPSLIILDSNIISKVIAAFCCTWMKNSTYMGPQIKFAAEKLQHFFAVSPLSLRHKKLCRSNKENYVTPKKEANVSEICLVLSRKEICVDKKKFVLYINTILYWVKKTLCGLENILMLYKN